MEKFRLLFISIALLGLTACSDNPWKPNWSRRYTLNMEDVGKTSKITEEETKFIDTLKNYLSKRGTVIERTVLLKNPNATVTVSDGTNRCRAYVAPEMKGRYVVSCADNGSTFLIDLKDETIESITLGSNVSLHGGIDDSSIILIFNDKQELSGIPVKGNLSRLWNPWFSGDSVWWF